MYFCGLVINDTRKFNEFVTSELAPPPEWQRQLSGHHLLHHNLVLFSIFFDLSFSRRQGPSIPGNELHWSQPLPLNHYRRHRLEVDPS